MLTWQRLAAVRDSHDGYALMLRTCNPSMRCRDWLMVGLPVGLPGLTAGWAAGIGCKLGCLHAGLVGQLLGCRPCDALLFPSLPLFPSLLLRRPVALGPLSGFARRLQSPVEAGTPACCSPRCCGGPFLWDRFRASPGACKVPSKRARRHADAAR